MLKEEKLRRMEDEMPVCQGESAWFSIRCPEFMNENVDFGMFP